MLSRQKPSISASVIIPNWNGKHLLKVCLNSLKNQSLKNFEVIIVDNGSIDGSVEYIRKYYPKFRVIPLKKNVGFAPAVNLGIKTSRSKNVVLINNDTKVDKDCLKKLVESAKKHKEVGMIAAKMLQFNNPNLIDSAGDYIDAVGHANNIGRGEKDGGKYNKSGFVFLVTGGGSLIKKEVFEKIGYLDDNYFAYMEDVDFGLRAQMVGFKAWYEPKAVIYHVHKATSSRNKAFTEYLQFRNMTMTIIKDFPKELFFKDFNWLKIILVNLNTVRFLAKHGYLRSAIKAEGYILLNLPRLLIKRRKIQSMMKVNPNYIIENVLPKRVTFFGLLAKGF